MEIQKIKYTDLNKTKALPGQQFKPGDLVFTRLDRGFHLIDFAIYLLQKLNRLFTGSKSKIDNSRFVHVAIVTDVKDGKVIIAEAMPAKGHQLRRVDFLQHNSYRLDPHDKYHYEIFRPTEEFQQTALKAVKIAKIMTAESASAAASSGTHKEEKETLLNEFSFRVAFKGMFKKDFSLSSGSKKRIFKAAYDDKNSNSYAQGGSKGRRFFCSSFIGYLFQRSLASELINEIPDNKVQKKGNKQVSEWSKERIGKEGESVVSQFTDKGLNYNYKYLIPSEFKTKIEEGRLFTKLVSVHGVVWAGQS